MLEVKRDPSLPPSNPGDILDKPLGFGKVFADRMIVAKYSEGKGWYEAELLPYGPLPLDPAATVLHYAQEIFEGLKAYYRKDGTIGFFRPEKNMERLNNSSARMCIPAMPVEDQLNLMYTLVREVKDWVPKKHGCSLYVRPVVIGTEGFLGVRPSNDYLYVVIVSPVEGYFASGFQPVKVKVFEEYVRAVKGGIGMAKAGANYSVSLLPGMVAKKEGYAQVMYLDAKDIRYVEEMGGMNVWFIREGKLITPELSGSILPGITRDSIMTILRDNGYEVAEEKIDFYQLIEDIRAGKVTEGFACGTAAVVTPISHFGWKGEDVQLGDGSGGAMAEKIFKLITDIQYGISEDKYGFVKILPE